MTSVISPSGMMSNLSSLSEPHDQPHDQPCLRCTMECAKLSIILSLRTESCNYKFLSLCCSSACHCHTQRTSSPCSLKQQARGPSQRSNIPLSMIFTLGESVVDWELSARAQGQPARAVSTHLPYSL